MVEVGAAAKSVDAVVIGAGFAGLYMVHKLRTLGMTLHAFEAGEDVGGTWYWNRYPGLRCDVESLDYSYSFSEEIEQEWEWTERFATQPEILSYLQFVADRLNLRDAFSFSTRVDSAHFDEETGLWRVTTESSRSITARFCIMATGSLSRPKKPDIPGIDTFEGLMIHSQAWPDEGVDLTGKRVGLIGTGSTGVQILPIVAEQAASLTVFQRTAAFCVPARNAPLSRDVVERHKSSYAQFRAEARDTPSGSHLRGIDKPAFDFSAEEREAEYEAQWQYGGPSFQMTFKDLLVNEEANHTAADFVRRKIHEIVENPQVREDLTPVGYPIAAKRICVGTDYYETFNRSNVELVNLRNDPIEAVDAKGIRTAAKHYDLDVLIIATGFDALTGALAAIDIRGRAGQSLTEKWQAGPVNYLGLMTAGFPNMFMIAGPGSPSVMTNVVASIEQHVEWLGDCLAYMRDHDLNLIEPTTADEERWTRHVNKVAESTLFIKAASWYVGANVPGKPQIFMPYAGGLNRYRLICDQAAASGYEGFVLN